MEYGHTGLPSPTVMKEFDYDDADIEAYIEKASGRGNGIQVLNTKLNLIAGPRKLSRTSPREHLAILT